jgi:hypothetical protein
VAASLDQSRDDLEKVEVALSAPLQVYKTARETYAEFAQSVRGVIGSARSPDSIRYLQLQLAFLREDAPEKLVSLEAARMAKAKNLFTVLSGHVELLKELYAPVQRFVDRHPPSDDAFRVAFSASLESDGFGSGLSTYVAQNKRGSFYGAEQAHQRIQALCKNVDYDQWPSVEAFLVAVTDALHVDARPGESSAKRLVSEQIRPGRKVAELYDFLYHLEYIRYRHQLTMGGRPLASLSPGEKGALLLVFYLLVDQDDCPLLIDQPEENLDNQSVFTVLVPFIREARRRRQVLLVTHNPNIAVVAGAEQVIFCEMDKGDGYRLSYTTGALEDPEMNKHVLDVLEGTRPAFSSRERTYQVSASLELDQARQDA